MPDRCRRPLIPKRAENDLLASSAWPFSFESRSFTVCGNVALAFSWRVSRPGARDVPPWCGLILNENKRPGLARANREVRSRDETAKQCGATSAPNWPKQPQAMQRDNKNDTGTGFGSYGRQQWSTTNLTKNMT